ncbi:MAG: DUF1841 family protein [Thiohalocapsa sp.]
MFKPDREQLRSVFLNAWRKAKSGEVLEPLEQQIVEVAKRHPEYQATLEAGDEMLDHDWLPEDGATNPFLHLGLHLSVLDQIATDRPTGIRKLYQQMIRTCLGDVHQAEHRIMDCVAEAVWKKQRAGGDLDQKAMLKCIKKRGGGTRERG